MIRDWDYIANVSSLFVWRENIQQADDCCLFQNECLKSNFKAIAKIRKLNWNSHRKNIQISEIIK